MTATVFEALSDKLSGVFDRLRRRGARSEADVTEALRVVRLALLEADVALNRATLRSVYVTTRFAGFPMSLTAKSPGGSGFVLLASAKSWCI